MTLPPIVPSLSTCAPITVLVLVRLLVAFPCPPPSIAPIPTLIPICLPAAFPCPQPFHSPSPLSPSSLKLSKGAPKKHLKSHLEIRKYRYGHCRKYDHTICSCEEMNRRHG
ncbi:hypothetical protein COCNU_scaffold012153G000170 [Cocos nucifera]|nr:hypothetical protein [Cocos nucifera]